MAETEEQSPASYPEPSTERPRRAHTILGRLSQAVREQNWFAVALELVIVIAGVVIGFQVTAWGQARANVAKEQAYLRQIVADLDMSVARLDREQPFFAETDRDAALLVQAFRTPERPELDSLLHWRQWAGYYRFPRVVTATADGLAATGDLALIRDDSLRSVLAMLPSEVQGFVVAADFQNSEIRRAVHGLNEGMDKVEAELSKYSDADRDSVARADPMSFFPAGEIRRPFPVVVEGILSDDQLYAQAVTLLDARRDQRNNRKALRRYLIELREIVDASMVE
ncbi:hypothetical protein [Rubrivirga sp. IMCC43871]|uniref:hypothetical protein n=1 Tax=Rubrivirga sp. IMCC43871 TaxID=3391575 RepID=UPI00398FC665